MLCAVLLRVSFSKRVKSQNYNYEELKMACDGFDDSKILGQGGQSIVYYGELKMRDRGGFGKQSVAVKLIDTTVEVSHSAKARQQQQKMRTQFYQEIEIMSKMNHPNICE